MYDKLMFHKINVTGKEHVCIAAERPLIQNNQQWLERPWLN